MAAPQPLAPMAERWTNIDLRSLGIDSVILAPLGSEVRPGSDGVIVRRPPDFAVQILARPVDFASKIIAIEHDPLRSLQRFVGGEPDTLVYETTSLDDKGGVEYHFVTQIESDGHFYTCEDVRGQRYSLADVDRMLRACKSLEFKSSGAISSAPDQEDGPSTSQSPNPKVPMPPLGGADLLP